MKLINADDIAISGWYMEDDDGEVYIKLSDVKECIDRVPTAYDVDAVVRELEQDYRDAIKIYGNDANGEYYYGVTRALHRAIQVVKRGGRNE